MRKIARLVITHDDKLLVIKRNKYGDEFYALPGGEVDEGETAERAAVREVLEEASIKSRTLRRVYHDESVRFGTTDYFLGEYISGAPKLAPESIEAKKMKKEDSTWEPMWLGIDKLPETRLLPKAIRDQLVHDLEMGFSDDILTIKVEEE